MRTGGILVLARTRRERKSLRDLASYDPFDAEQVSVSPNTACQSECAGHRAISSAFQKPQGNRAYLPSLVRPRVRRMWTGVVWREAGNYGPGGMFEARQNLGSHTFPHDPEVGFVLEINDEQYQVTEVYLGFCHVRPTRMKPL
jgi:hypothetical protein